MSRISDLLISSLRKPCKSSSSRSGTSFLHDQTSITGFTEDHAQDMPYIASNTVISFHNAVIFIGKISEKVSLVAWMQSLSLCPIIFG
jgi:hypothetical protein